MTMPNAQQWAVLEDLDDVVGLEPVPDELLDGAPVPVPDPDRANRILRRIARLDDNEQLVKVTVAGERDRINQFEADRLGTIERERAWLRDCLEGFSRQHFAATHEKSVKLPNGTLSLRKASSRTVVDDEAEAIAWAAVNQPEAVKTTLQRSKIEATAQGGHTQVDAEGVEVTVAQLVTEAGEVVPGIHTETPLALSFSVKVGG